MAVNCADAFWWTLSVGFAQTFYYCTLSEDECVQ